MLEDLLHKKVIELPECKHPEEMGRVNDPNLQLISRDETQKSVKSSRDQTKQEFFLGKIIDEGFNPKAYKLLAKVRYDFTLSS